MKLYGALASPYVARVVLTARAKDIVLTLEMPPGGLKSPAYLAISPFGKMPVLEHDGQTLIESQVICEYLEDLRPEPALLPPDPLGRARIRALCRVLDLYVGTEAAALFRQMNPATRDAAAVESGKTRLATALTALDTLLGQAPPPGTTGLNMADCTLLPYLRMVQRTVVPAFGAIDPESLPQLRAWIGRMRAHPLAGPFIPEYEGAVDAFLASLRGG